MISALVLPFPDFGLPFILDTDDSAESIGAVLAQAKEGKEYVLATPIACGLLWRKATSRGAGVVVVDFRKLISSTLPDRYPMPRLGDIIQSLDDSNTIFSTLDLLSGFFKLS